MRSTNTTFDQKILTIHEQNTLKYSHNENNQQYTAALKTNKEI